MRKIILILLIASNLLFGKVFYNLENAINYATQVRKPILLFIYSPTCPHCSNYFYQMKSNRRILAYIARNYVVCMLSVNKAQIPPNIDFTGLVPYTDILFFNGKPIAPSIKGEIPMNYLYEYLLQGNILFQKILQKFYY